VAAEVKKSRGGAKNGDVPAKKLKSSGTNAYPESDEEEDKEPETSTDKL